MRAGSLTVEVLERNFKYWLKKAITEGVSPPSETGLDVDVLRLIGRVASSWPAINGKAVDAARQAFSDQLDGSASARREAAWDAYLREKLNG